MSPKPSGQTVCGADWSPKPSAGTVWGTDLPSKTVAKKYVETYAVGTLCPSGRHAAGTCVPLEASRCGYVYCGLEALLLRFDLPFMFVRTLWVRLFPRTFVFCLLAICFFFAVVFGSVGDAGGKCSQTVLVHKSISGSLKEWFVALTCGPFLFGLGHPGAGLGVVRVCPQSASKNPLRAPRGTQEAPRRSEIRAHMEKINVGDCCWGHCT